MSNQTGRGEEEGKETHLIDVSILKRDIRSFFILVYNGATNAAATSFLNPVFWITRMHLTQQSTSDKPDWTAGHCRLARSTSVQLSDDDDDRVRLLPSSKSAFSLPSSSLELFRNHHHPHHLQPLRLDVPEEEEEENHSMDDHQSKREESDRLMTDADAAKGVIHPFIFYDHDHFDLWK